MCQEQLKAFLEKVISDASLQAKLKAAKSQDDVVSIAKEHGHDFGTEHISQLSAEELESVDGGTGSLFLVGCFVDIVVDAAIGKAIGS